MATKPKPPEDQKPRGPTRPKVLTDAQYAILIKKIGPQPKESDDLDQHMLWAARMARAHVLNGGTRDSLIIAGQIIKTHNIVVGTKAPPGKTETLAASKPVRRDQEP